MFQRIVVPLDGSLCAEKAIPIASRLARASGGSLVLVHVILPPVDFGKYTAPRLVNSERIAFENNQARATSYLASMLINHAKDLAGIDVDMGVAVGLVPETICSVACKEQSDLIILSYREETGLKRWFLGSIAQEIMHRSSVPILVLNEQSVIPRMLHSAYPLQAQVILDGSPMSETVLEPTAKLLAALAAPAKGILHLVRGANLSPASDSWRNHTLSDSLWRKLAVQEAEMYLARVIDRFYKGPLASLELEVTSSVVDCTDMSKTIFKVVEDMAKSELEGASNLIAITIPRNRSMRHHIEKRLSKHILGSTRLSLLTTFPQEIATQSGLR
ncbi:MAG TPA: universal stress protein [Ktedonobacteraceae bacterium]|nr:universal stress protein [Ktedonobacteraceae bacterium]